MSLLTTLKRTVSAVAILSVSWAGYDGTNNSVQAGFIASDYDRFAAAAQSDTSMLLVTGVSSTLEAYRITNTNGTLSKSSVLSTLTTTGYAYAPQLLKMSDTRYLCIAVDLGDQDIGAYLLDADGATVDSAVTVDTNNETLGSLNWPAATKLTSTLAVYAFRDDNNMAYVIGIDVTGDTVSFGTKLQVSTSTANTHIGICRISDTKFLVVVSGVAYVFTASGTTLTKHDGVTLDGNPGGNGNTCDLIEIGDGSRALCVMSDSTPTPSNYHVFGWIITVTGTTPASGTIKQYTSGTPSAFDNQHCPNACAIHTTDGLVDQVLFCNSTDDGGQGLKTFVIEINTTTWAHDKGSGGIVNYDTSDNLANNGVFAFQESGYAVCFAEDTVASQVQATVLAI